MTAKQKANQARFKKVVAEAKKLRKKNPKLTQAQAVKQAWAIMYSKKKIGYSETRNELNKKVTEEIRKGRKKDPDEFLNPYRKKNAIKQAYVSAGFSGIKKKSKPKKSSSYHKDTKSHNVNIRVMSGVNSNMYTIRDNYEKEIKYYLDSINRIKDSTNSMTPTEKGRAVFVIKTYKKVISKLKKQLKDQNKLINDLLK